MSKLLAHPRRTAAVTAVAVALGSTAAALVFAPTASAATSTTRTGTYQCFDDNLTTGPAGYYASITQTLTTPDSVAATSFFTVTDALSITFDDTGARSLRLEDATAIAASTGSVNLYVDTPLGQQYAGQQTTVPAQSLGDEKTQPTITLTGVVPNGVSDVMPAGTGPTVGVYFAQVVEFQLNLLSANGAAQTPLNVTCNDDSVFDAPGVNVPVTAAPPTTVPPTTTTTTTVPPTTTTTVPPTTTTTVPPTTTTVPPTTTTTTVPPTTTTTVPPTTTTTVPPTTTTTVPPTTTTTVPPTTTTTVPPTTTTTVPPTTTTVPPTTTTTVPPTTTTVPPTTTTVPPTTTTAPPTTTTTVPPTTTTVPPTTTPPTTGAADVRVGLSTPTSVKAGGTGTIKLTVRNYGPSASAATQADLFVAGGLSFATTGGGKVSGIRDTFAVPALKSGQAIVFTLTVKDNGSLSLAAIAATVTPGAHDPVLTNNVAGKVLAIT